MIVYVEEVFLENFFIDIMLFILVLKTLKQSLNWGGIVVAGLFGALFSLACIKICFGEFFNIFIKIVAAFFMSVMLGFNFRKVFLKMILLIFYTFLFGGMIYAIDYLLSVNIQSYKSLSISIGGITAICFLLFFALFVVIKKIYNYKKISNFLYDIKISINGKCANLKGFLDTGNTLTNNNGKPVCLVSEKTLKNWFTIEERLLIFLKKYSQVSLKNKQTLNVKSVSGEKRIFVFDVQRCCINKKNVDIAVGIGDDLLFKKKDFNIILSPQVLEV